MTDVQMPEMDGLEFISCAKTIGIDVPVIFFSAYANKNNALRALRLGAFDFIEKPFQMSYLVSVVKKALSKDTLRFIRKLQNLKLSSKQMEILELLLQGKTNREIAEAVDLAEPTVKYHVGSFFKQFGANTRFELKEKVLDLVESRFSDIQSEEAKPNQKIATT